MQGNRHALNYQTRGKTCATLLMSLDMKIKLEVKVKVKVTAKIKAKVKALYLLPFYFLSQAEHQFGCTSRWELSLAQCLFDLRLSGMLATCSSIFMMSHVSRTITSV